MPRTAILRGRKEVRFAHGDGTRVSDDGTRVSALAQRAGKTRQSMTQLLDLGHELADDSEDVRAARGGADQLRAAIVGIGDALEVAVALQLTQLESLPRDLDGAL